MTKEKQVEKTKEKKEENKIRMYIGPTLEKMGLASGIVITGELKGLYKEAIDKIPEIEKLFVPVNQNLAIEKKLVKERGTFQNIYYNKIKELGGK